MKLPALIVTGATGLLIFAGAWTAGRAAVSLTVPEPRAPAPLSEADRALRLAGVRLSAPLAPEAADLLGPRDGPYLLLAVREADLRTCEDIGRQMRDLRRGDFAALPAVMLTDSASEARIRAFLRREKLRIPLHVLGSIDGVLQQPKRLHSPAALRVAGGRAEGIAFPNRIPGVRNQSFAQALATVAAPTPSGAGRTDSTTPGGD